ncbi:glycosyltransferase family 4 protein [Myxococcota bacterium]|nr:glycosyltransferase family 4 protein [Myxococcota bacterium]
MSHRILYLHASPGIPLDGPGGASRHVRETLRAMVAVGHSVEVVCRRPTVRSGDPPPDLGVPVHSLAPGGLPGTLRRSPAVDEVAYDARLSGFARKVAVRFRPTLVYERYSLFSAAGGRLARALGVPLVLEVNAPLALERVRYEGLKPGPHLRLAERLVFAAAARICAVSSGVAAHVRAVPGVDPDRVRLVPNGVDPRRFAPRAPDPALRRRWDLEGRFVVGFAGSLKPWHAVHDVLRAVAAVEWEAAGAPPGAPLEPVLLVVGDGLARGRLEALAGDLSASHRVRFAGHVPEEEVPGLMALFDVACAPYPVLEPFWFCPLKAVEAMAMGIPVIATRIGDLPHLVGARTDAPAAGALVPPGEPGAWVEHLGRLRADPRRRRAMGEEGRRRVLAEHTWEGTVRAALDGL